MSKLLRLHENMEKGKNLYVVAIKWTGKKMTGYTHLTQNIVKANKPETAIKKCIEWYVSGVELNDLFIKDEEFDIRVNEIRQ